LIICADILDRCSRTVKRGAPIVKSSSVRPVRWALRPAMSPPPRPQKQKALDLQGFSSGVDGTRSREETHHQASPGLTWRVNSEASDDAERTRWHQPSPACRKCRKAGSEPTNAGSDGAGQGGHAPDAYAATSPRRRLVSALTEAVSAAIEAGDPHAARVAHEALGRLIAEPEAGVAPVADLGAARARRGQP
jgi:hypothetical protein